MKISIKWPMVALNLFASLFILGGIFAISPIVAVAAGIGTGIGMGFVSMPQGVLSQVIQTTIWQNHIEGVLFKDNSFINKSVNVSSAIQSVNGFKYVIIPQAGDAASVTKNRRSLPARVTQRSDSFVSYGLDVLTSDPRVIEFQDDKELSYDYRNSIIGDDLLNMEQAIAEITLLNWVKGPANVNAGAAPIPTSRIRLTTGSSVLATAVDATGNRKAVTRKDFQLLQAAAIKENRWVDGRMYALIPADWITQLWPADDQIAAINMLQSQVSDKEREMGIIAVLHGWKIMIRSSVYVLTDAQVVREDNTTAATDNQAALFWYDGAVEVARDSVEMLYKSKDPTYYGDVLSFAARIGGRARRTKYEGVFMLQQDAA